MCLIILFRFFVRSDTTPFARFASKAARSTETKKLTQIIIGIIEPISYALNGTQEIAVGYDRKNGQTLIKITNCMRDDECHYRLECVLGLVLWRPIKAK